MFWSILVSTFVVLVIVWTIYRLVLSQTPRLRNEESVKTMIVLGSGGHTMEMIELIQHLNWNRYKPVHFVAAAGDHVSSTKIPEVLKSKCELHIVNRSREVGQSYFTSVLTTLLATLESLLLIWKIRPELLICNGPGTCLPLCICCKLLSNTVIIYVESFCRVENLSLTGKVLYPFVDQFIVQWPQLQSKYPRSKYLGILF